MLTHQQDVGGVAGGEREGAQVLGLEVVQVGLAGAARLQDVDRGATPYPLDRAVPELSTTSPMSGFSERIRQTRCWSGH